MPDYLDIVEVFYVERRDTALRNALLIGLAGAGDSDVDPDQLAEFASEHQHGSGVVRDPEARQAVIAQLAAG